MNKIFSEIENRRYLKQIQSAEVGIEGQVKLKQSKILVVGAGSMGVPVLQYLAAAGVGILGICDFKTIQEADFPAQIMYGMGDLGKLKTIVAKEKLQLLNPFISIQIHNIQLREENVRLICEGYDLIIDCTNDLSLALLILRSVSIPLLIGRLTRSAGYLWFFPQGEKRPEIAELSDIIPETNVFGSLYGIVGCMLAFQAMQVVLSNVHEIKSLKINF
ncbi:MAG: ThiF family adenylyltransferase [Bacteroidales bacterium]|nr:ThiF family adenylyltransferase [Bacteroidales bacterium]